MVKMNKKAVTSNSRIKTSMIRTEIWKMIWMVRVKITTTQRSKCEFV